MLPVGDADSRKDAPHSRAAGGEASEQIGVKHKREENVGTLLFQKARKARRPPSEGTGAFDVQKENGNPLFPQFRKERRIPAVVLFAAEDVDNGRETDGVKPGCQFGERLFGAADRQFRNTERRVDL